ncbi:unnamed protein product [Jaminaea pallidilutea]
MAQQTLFPQHLQHVPGPPLPVPQWVPKGWPTALVTAALSAIARLEMSTSIGLSIERFKYWLPRTSRTDRFKFAFMILMATFSMIIMRSPSFPLKLGIPALYILAILVPLTSQFFLPASPIFLWLLFYYSSGFLSPSTRPHIWVSVLSTLETIWYGANISDILTRAGHPFLDVMAWIPYGIVHFAGPFFVAAFLFVFGPPGAVKFFGSAFGFLNLVGVIVQVCFPTAPPWYELREGLTPANYSMKGSPAGLARIDALLGGHGYTVTFTNAPVPFGAFPSLHAGSATMEALFCSYFFPIQLQLGGVFERVLGRGKKLYIDVRIFYWTYAFWLYWCTMYLMHHYLVDLVGGGCLATLCFYLFLDDEQRHYMEETYPTNPSAPAPFSTLQASHSQLNLDRQSMAGDDDLAMESLRNRSSNDKDVESGIPRASETLFAVTEEGEEEDAGGSSGSTAGAAAPSKRARAVMAPEKGGVGSRSSTPKPATSSKQEDKQQQQQQQQQQHQQSAATRQSESDARDSFDDWGA